MLAISLTEFGMLNKLMIPYDLNALGISQRDFVHHSFVHGMGHTLRVSIFCALLGELIGQDHEGQKAAVAALFHDMARNHDSVDPLHGKRAAKTIVPKFKEYIYSLGFDDKDICAMQCAIEWHCYKEELPQEHPMSLITYILKDADALDRIRIKDFDPKYLRLAGDTAMVDIAKAFYRKVIYELSIFLQSQGFTDSVCEEIDKWIDSPASFPDLLSSLEKYPQNVVLSVTQALECPQLYHRVVANYNNDVVR